MRCLMCIFFVIFLSSISLVEYSFAGQFDKKKLENLVSQWKERDGGAVAELSFELSKAFVASDTMFLDIMLANPDDFESWVAGLEDATFTVYRSRDEVDDMLYTAYYEKLKNLMLEKCSKYVDHKRYKKLANILRNRLGSMKIKIVD